VASGIKIKETLIGTGLVAERGKIAVAHIRGFLPRGDECYNTYEQGQPLRIDLAKRECIAGLRKGIVGMRAGGRRELIVSPHLAYGERGLPGRIPPNAVIRFEVELLEVREAGVLYPDDYQPGKLLLVSRPGEAARNLPRWQFGFREGESAGAVITYPLPGLTWRYARRRNVEIKLDPAQMAELIQSVQSTLAGFPEDCLKHDVLWNDASEKANGITRDLRTNSLCVSITLSEREVTLCKYSLPETSPVLMGATFYQVITRSLATYLPDEIKLP
jgi:hypothetical protein